MRITNKIMQNNSISNINNIKVMSDDLNNQMTTGKKTNKPSDDPVVAIRALRLRSNLSEVSQYYEKNVPDASSWLSLTESALDTTSDILKDMIEQCQRGSQDSLKTSDRDIILASLKSLRDEVYSTGDGDYLGRGLFTGYRTDTKLSFQEDTTADYEIKESISVSDIHTKKYSFIGNVADTTAESANAATASKKVDGYEVNRLQLAYEQCEDTPEPTIKYWDGTYDNNGKRVYTDLPVTDTVSSSKIGTDDDPYVQAATDPDAVIYIPETGEVLLGKDVNDRLKGLPAKGEIMVTYEKSSWKEGDLRPEHYFECTDKTNTAKPIKYNEGKADASAEQPEQIIAYDVGFNQTIRVNTLAANVYTHDIGRKTDDLIDTIERLDSVESVVADLKEALKEKPDDADLKAAYESALKAQDLLKADLQSQFAEGITFFQSKLDQTTKETTDVGSRESRLTLVSNRLKSQQSNFKTLSSENEDCDQAEVAIQLSSAEYTYEAALLATGKISQANLLNYI